MDLLLTHIGKFFISDLYIKSVQMKSAVDTKLRGIINTVENHNMGGNEESW